MKLSIIIPVYNSASMITILHSEINKIISELNYKDNFELILVNDSSLDDSWNKIQKLSRNFSYVIGLNLSENFGQHNAIMAGLSICSGKKIITLDDDLQHSPSFFPEILKKLDYYDVCYTYYRKRKHILWKKTVSNLNNLISSLLLNKPINIYMSSFRGLNKKIVEEILKFKKSDVYIDGLIIKSTKNIGMITVDHYPRKFGETNYTFKKLFILWSNMIINFSFFPFRFPSIFGIILKFIVMIFRKKNNKPQFKILEKVSHEKLE